jgi:photosynthetic reaction center cytochrome c subunit
MTSVRILGIATFIVLAGLVVGGVKAKSTGQIPPAQTTAALTATPKKAEEQFKNIQVLKGVPAEQIFPTMQFIAASLGVECEFCHVHNAFDKDDKKPKKTARKMMEMMFAINKDNFDGHREVTCYSCHRGSPHPLAIPVVASADATLVVSPPREAAGEAKESEVKVNAGPTADQLIDKYVRAIGGAAATDKISTRVMKGTIDFGGKSLPIDIYAKDPDERISLTHMPEGDSVTAFNGHEGWLGIQGRQLREMHGSDLDGAAIDADLHLATHLKQMFSQMEVRESEKIDTHATYEVVGQREGKPPIQLYFDQQSGLLIRLVRYGETALGWLPTQIDYADYREVDGVKVPYRWTLARPSGRFTIQIADLRQNVPVDDAKFVKPNMPQEPPKTPAR